MNRKLKDWLGEIVQKDGKSYKVLRVEDGLYPKLYLLGQDKSGEVITVHPAAVRQDINGKYEVTE